MAVQLSDEPSSQSGDEALEQRAPVSHAPRKGTPWSNEEHLAFLKGLEKLGRGNWRDIARKFVPTRTPTQVASHAQKHFLRVGGATKRRSRFSQIELEVLGSMPAVSAAVAKHAVRISSPAAAAAAAIKSSALPIKQEPTGHGLPNQHGCMQPAIGVPVPASSASSGSEGTAVCSGGSPAQGVPCFMPPLMFGYPGAGFPPFMFPPSAMSILPVLAEVYAAMGKAAAGATAAANGAPSGNEVTSHHHPDYAAALAAGLLRPEAQSAAANAMFNSLLAQLQLTPRATPVDAEQLIAAATLLQPSAGSAFRPLAA